MPKLKITRKYAKEFDDKCAKSDSHGFLSFITEPDYYNITTLDLISQIESILKFKPFKHDRDIDLNEEKISNYMNDFFSLYMPQKAVF